MSYSIPCSHSLVRRGGACLLLAILGCVCMPVVRATSPVPAVTGSTIDSQEVRRTFPAARLAEAAYLQVNSQWLKAYYRIFRKQLAAMGIVRWDSRFDCRRFSGLYTDFAQAEVQASQPASDHPLAIGQVWYSRDNNGGGHAIVFALTERGRIFIEPQTGEEVMLSAKEQASIYFAML